MKKRALIVLSVVTIAVVSLLVSSCDLFGLFTISGKVVNVKADTSGDYWKGGGYSLEGATVTFTDTTDSSKKFTGTVNGGNYTTELVPKGRYTISGKQSGWTFIPIQFDVAGILSDAPDLLAFPSSDAGSLTVVLSWTNKSRDMDLHATWGTASTDTPPDSNHVYYQNPSESGTGFDIALDRDVTGSKLQSQPLVETITLTHTSGSIDTGGTPNEFRFYIDSYGKSHGTTGDDNVSPAGATVNVFQGTNAVGTYYAPFNTAERTLRILDVVFSGTSFTVYTDTETANNNQFLSLGSNKSIGIPVSVIQ